MNLGGFVTQVYPKKFPSICVQFPLTAQGFESKRNQLARGSFMLCQESKVPDFVYALSTVDESARLCFESGFEDVLRIRLDVMYIRHDTVFYSVSSISKAVLV